MIDYEILSSYGTDDAVIKDFFTAEEPTSGQRAKMTVKEIRARERTIKMRAKFQRQISGWLQEHIVRSLADHSKYAAVDMAWDSFPTNNVIVPLMAYAQGRVDMAKTGKWLGEADGGEDYVRKGPNGEIVGIDLPKFFEININLLRSVITRRVAAQSEKYRRLNPYFKYDPRDQTQVGKCRADMVSQRMDIMADQYGYRHFQDQRARDMLLYAKAVAFPRQFWEREIQVEKQPGDIEREADGKLRTRTRVSREGISWMSPHPSRVFCDNNYPITSLNEDNGCEYIGFWDVTRWGDISNNGDYYNRKKVSYTSGMVDWFSTYWAYFNQYFNTITPPSFPQPAGDNVNYANDRKNQIGLFTGQMDQVSTIFCHLWVKVRPQNWGWGTYPHPVWVHLKVAGDSTVVYSKICPSSPAAVFSYNENDARMFNISMAHELMPFQDQMTNLTSQLLEVVKQDLFSVAVLNTDVFPEDAHGKKARAEFEKLLQNGSKFASTHLLEVSFRKLTELGIKPEQAFVVVRSQPNAAIENILKAMKEVMDMADRLMVMSPHEQGQAATHEISATESHEISQSTDTVYDFISSGIDEGRAAMKRICYESLIACGSDQVELTVANRYPEGVVEAAGFMIQQDAPWDPVGYVKLTGSKDGLVHEYCYTARDGGDRPAGPAAAQILVQMLQAIGSLEQNMQQAILSAMGKAKLFEIFNQIFRSIDAGVDMTLELKAGDDDQLIISNDKQFQANVARMAQMIQKDTQDITAMHQVIASICEVIGRTNPAAAQAMQQIMQQMNKPNQPPPPNQLGQSPQASPPPQ